VAMLVTVTLPGPAPWGFRITGGRDFGRPITISKVTERGKAAAGDLRLGDVIVTINGESAGEMLNVEAQNKIKQSPGQLQLQVERWVLGYGGEDQPGPHPLGHEVLCASVSLRRLRSPTACAWVGFSPPPATLGALPSPQEPVLALTSLSFQNRGSLSRQNSSPGPALPPPPRPPSPGLGAPPNPWEMFRERRRSSSSPSPCNSLGSEPAMRRLEEDSEVFKMLQENRELRAAPRQSSTFRLLQEALEEEGEAPFPSRLSPSARKPVAAVQKLHICEKCGSTIATQAVRIQDGRYRHGSCYTCADCGLSLKMRGHFWAGEELYCEKHARLRYQGALGGGTTTPPRVDPNS
ncbi:PDLI2 protein, partial [Crotophaga sulcirostris]|nr:PDLI2 protein [Crotophaga sulcirostris]